VEREIAFGGRDEFGTLDGLTCGLLGQLDRAGAVVDLRDAQVVLVGEGLLDVGDGVRRAGDGLRDTRGSLRALTDPAGEVRTGTRGPGAVRRGLEVLLEVVGGARRVRAHDRGDVRVGQLSALVESGDGRIVPRGDRAVEDLRGRLGVQHELVDTLDVVGQGHRAENQRQVPCGIAGATLGGLCRLLVLDGRVGAGEVDLVRDELRAAVTGAGGVVRDVDVRALLGAHRDVGGDELVHRVLLGRGARTRQGGLAVACRGGGGRVDVDRAGIVVGTARRECESCGGHHAEQGAVALEVHLFSSEKYFTRPPRGRRRPRGAGDARRRVCSTRPASEVRRRRWTLGRPKVNGG